MRFDTYGALALVLLLSNVANARNSPVGITVGVDYYPEQWALGDMDSDMKSIKQDLGADMIRLGEFMWETVEPKVFPSPKHEARAEMGLRLDMAGWGV